MSTNIFLNIYLKNSAANILIVTLVHSYLVPVTIPHLYHFYMYEIIYLSTNERGIFLWIFLL